MRHRLFFTQGAVKRFRAISDYILNKTGSAQLAEQQVLEMQRYLLDVLLPYPEVGVQVDFYGKGVRKISHKGYAVLYRINLLKNRIDILSIYRYNQP
jgi:plasmid stabilization system protein ParE